VTLYAYKGRSAGGESVRGSMEADSPDGVATRLTQGGIIPIDIRMAAAAAGAGASKVGGRRHRGVRSSTSAAPSSSRLDPSRGRAGRGAQPTNNRKSPCRTALAFRRSSSTSPASRSRAPLR